jgi:hypothetical protein
MERIRARTEGFWMTFWRKSWIFRWGQSHACRQLWSLSDRVGFHVVWLDGHRVTLRECHEWCRCKHARYVQFCPESYCLIIPLAGFMHCRSYFSLLLFAVMLNTLGQQTVMWTSPTLPYLIIRSGDNSLVTPSTMGLFLSHDLMIWCASSPVSCELKSADRWDGCWQVTRLMAAYYQLGQDKNYPPVKCVSFTLVCP